MPDPLHATVHRVVASQRAYFEAGETRSLSTRTDALRRLELALKARQGEMLEALATDLGKPAIEAFLAEYYFLLQEIRLVRRSLHRWLKPRSARSPLYFLPCRNRIERHPFGVTLVMAPWNYPIQLALSPLIAAVAAGNTVVLKPSELTPACEAFLTSLLSDCFPPEHVAVVTGGAEVAEALLREQFDFLFFTGSTETGKIVARQAAEHLTPHILELGGKCPCIVDRTADLPATARRILLGKLFNAGQTCFAPDFVLVHTDIKEALVKEFAELLERLPWEKDMARIVNQHHFQRLQQLIDGESIAKGSDDPGSLHLAPRLLPSATWNSPAMKDEIFGPLLPILPFADLDDLLAQLRPRPSPLALYAFSRDDHFLRTVLDHIPSGGVSINDIGKHAMNLNLPFGGVGASGHGRYRGKSGVEAFTYERAITKRYFLPDPSELVPPREKRAAFLRKWLG